MEEKVIVKSTHYNIKKLSIIANLILIALSISILVFTIVSMYADYSEDYNADSISLFMRDCQHMKSETIGYGEYRTVLKAVCTEIEQVRLMHPTVWSYIDCCGYWQGDIVWSLFWLPLCFLPLVLFLYLLLEKQSIVVSDKRVYGRTSFGRRVDLPLDSVSAVGTNAFNSIAISTSSGRISFMAIKNRDEIHKVLSDLLIGRQGKSATASVVKQEIPQSNADELKKFKELLDSGIITQEEFDEKKKQLLGL